METTDVNLAGPEGVLNTQAKQLANRTKYLKDAIDRVGILGPHYRGLNAIIENVVFANGVSYGDAVYITEEGTFAKSLADLTDYVGIADITANRVILLGVVSRTVVGAQPGDLIYVSEIDYGELTTIASSICVGKYLIDDTICLSATYGASGAGSEENIRRIVWLHS
jgi:hypothetical protein